MQRMFKLLMILIIFLTCIGYASAVDVNATDGGQAVVNDTDTATQTDDVEESVADDAIQKSNEIVERNTSSVSIKSNQVKTGDTLQIYLKDSNGAPIKSKMIIASLNNENHKIYTNSRGIANLDINLPSGIYNLKLSFSGDNDYDSSKSTYSLKVYKLTTQIDHFSNFIVKNGKLSVCLKDERGKSLSDRKVTFKINGRTYKAFTNKNGRATIKLRMKPKKYVVNVKFNGDRFHKPYSKNFKLHITKHTSFYIENNKLLTKGFLRIYLKDISKSAVSKKTFTISIGDKKFTKRTNSEGIIVIKPNVKPGFYSVSAKYGRYWLVKNIRCIEGNVKDPLRQAIPLANGAPDIDVMPKNYVTADAGGTYTLKKSQYREVLKRDSYCLFLNNKLTKYTFFKTKNQPNTYHIIVREKWNVIEKAINYKLVEANSPGYWPKSIKVSLKGKSYTYPEVRDVQDTEYTCGPTSCSMCSQVLKNYLCEKYIAKKAGTDEDGTACHGMIQALKKHNYKCTYFYRDSYYQGIKELKKGGCALVFHTKNHYVAILDISKDGKKVLVSNSYGSYYDIPSKWLTVKYMKTRYYMDYDDGLIVRLDYKLSESLKSSVNSYYSSMGPNWAGHNTHEKVS